MPDQTELFPTVAYIDVGHGMIERSTRKKTPLRTSRRNKMTPQEASAMVMEKRNIKMALLRGKNDEFSSRLAEIERALELFYIMN